MNPTNSPEDFYRGLLQKVLELTTGERGCVVLLNPESGLMEPIALHNWDDARVTKEKPIIANIIQTVISNFTPVITSNARDGIGRKTEDGDYVFPYPLRSVICVPFKIKAQIGVVFVD